MIERRAGPGSEFAAHVRLTAHENAFPRHENIVKNGQGFRIAEAGDGRLEVLARAHACQAHNLVQSLGICRYGEAMVPMDEALAQVTLDISGRPYLVCQVPPLPVKVGDFDLELVEEFLQAFVNNSGITLHVAVITGKNSHHIVEAVFKAFARALDVATQIDERTSGVPSTKGSL